MIKYIILFIFFICIFIVFRKIINDKKYEKYRYDFNSGYLESHNDESINMKSNLTDKNEYDQMKPCEHIDENKITELNTNNIKNKNIENNTNLKENSDMSSISRESLTDSFISIRLKHYDEIENNILMGHYRHFVIGDSPWYYIIGDVDNIQSLNNEDFQVLTQEIPIFFDNEGIDINAINGEGYTLLNMALSREDIQFVRILIELGARFSKLSLKYDYIALKLLVKKKNLELLNYLVDINFDLSLRDSSKKSILHEACSVKWREGIKCLVEFGLSLEDRDMYNKSALDYYCMEQNKPMIYNSLVFTEQEKKIKEEQSKNELIEYLYGNDVTNKEVDESLELRIPFSKEFNSFISKGTSSLLVAFCLEYSLKILEEANKFFRILDNSYPKEADDRINEPYFVIFVSYYAMFLISENKLISSFTSNANEFTDLTSLMIAREYSKIDSFDIHLKNEYIENINKMIHIAKRLEKMNHKINSGSDLEFEFSENSYEIESLKEIIISSNNPNEMLTLEEFMSLLLTDIEKLVHNIFIFGKNANLNVVNKIRDKFLTANDLN